MAEDRFADAASSVLSGELVCGYVDAEGEIHKDFDLHEMNGHDEDVLASTGPVTARLNKVIHNCLDRLGQVSDKQKLWTAVTQLTMPDRLLMLIRIRQVSIGKDFRMTIVCPECKKNSHVTVDLSALETRPMAEPTKRVREDEIPGGILVKWHIMTGDDEEWLSTQQKQKGQDKLTLAILSRVDAIGTYEFDRKTPMGLRGAMQMLKAMPTSKRNAIRGLFRAHEGAVDTEILYDCPGCQMEIRGDLEIGQPGFFFPQET